MLLSSNNQSHCGSYNILMSQVNSRAQVPGYCGYIPGKNSENKFGSTFGQVTKESYPSQQQSFLTTNLNNNQFIQQQYTADHRFWGNQGKISTFKESSQQPIKHNKRIDVPKYSPQPVSNLTYQQATSKAYKH